MTWLRRSLGCGKNGAGVSGGLTTGHDGLDDCDSGPNRVMRDRVICHRVMRDLAMRDRVICHQVMRDLAMRPVVCALFVRCLGCVNTLKTPG
jgi:hypothetical protein